MLPPVPHAVTIRVLCNSPGQETSFPYLLSNYGNTLEKHGTVNHHSVALRRQTNKQPIVDTGESEQAHRIQSCKNYVKNIYEPNHSLQISARWLGRGEIARVSSVICFRI